MKWLWSVLTIVVWLVSAPTARAQGVQTGTITGTVQSADSLSLPGVTVTASSPVLQGQRSSVTDVNGVYFIKGLPAGIYTVTFELSSFRTATKSGVGLQVGSSAGSSRTMALASGSPTVGVVVVA